MATRKNSTDRIGWADLTNNKLEGGCSPIVRGEIDADEACHGDHGQCLVYDERTDTIYSVANHFRTDIVSEVCETLDQYEEDEL